MVRPAKDMHDKVALHDQFVESMRPMMEGRVTANEIEICLACGRSLANALEDDETAGIILSIVAKVKKAATKPDSKELAEDLENKVLTIIAEWAEINGKAGPEEEEGVVEDIQTLGLDGAEDVV